jgi:TRAP-type C4-dicarboxylate transport system permease small subunit
MSRWWAYGFLVLGLLGAATALLQTMMRNKAGDDIDEAKL